MYLSIQVCLFNLLFVILVSLALPCRTWRPLMSGVCTVWTCVVTVCKMLYQLNVVQPTKYSSNCTMVIIIRRSEYTVYTALCFSLSGLFHLSFFYFLLYLVYPQPENSTIDLSPSLLYAGPIDPAQWVGLWKTNGKLLDYLRVSSMLLLIPEISST